jgi:hypothetical protein
MPFLSPELTPITFFTAFAMGFYVLGGELLWIGRKAFFALSGSAKGRENPALIWRQHQIEHRKKLFPHHLSQEKYS